MIFKDVKVHSGKEPPEQPIPNGGLVIWFEAGTDNVWLDWWAGDGPWIEWKKGFSIGQCLTGKPDG